MDQKKIWEYYQQHSGVFFARSYSRIEWLAKYAQRLTGKGAEILNIGVGSGYFEELAALAGMKISSLDPDINTLTKIKERLGIPILKMRIEEATGLENFDMIIASEIIEHLDDEKLGKGLDKIFHGLKKGGILLGTVPWNEDLSENIVICPHCSEHFHRWGHERSFTIASLTGMLTRSFISVSVRKKLFIPWKELNWKGKISSFFKLVYFISGGKVNGVKLVFTAVK